MNNPIVKSSKTPFAELKVETRLAFRLFTQHAKEIPGLVDDIEHAFGVCSARAQQLSQVALSQLIWQEPQVAQRAAMDLAVINGGDESMFKVANSIGKNWDENHTSEANRRLAFLCMIATSEVDFSANQVTSESVDLIQA